MSGSRLSCINVHIDGDQARCDDQTRVFERTADLVPDVITYGVAHDPTVRRQDFPAVTRRCSVTIYSSRLEAENQYATGNGGLPDAYDIKCFAVTTGDRGKKC